MEKTKCLQALLTQNRIFSSSLPMNALVETFDMFVLNNYMYVFFNNLALRCCYC